MTVKNVTFELAPVYNKLNVDYKQADATAIFPGGDQKFQAHLFLLNIQATLKAGKVTKLNTTSWQTLPAHDLSYTLGEPGLAGHWIKRVLHLMFNHKAKVLPFWWMIPE